MDEPRVILTGSQRHAVPGATRLQKSDAQSALGVTVVLARRAAIGNETLHAHACSLPGARPDLDRTEFTALYGASDEAIAAVGAFAKGAGLSVTHVDACRRVVELGGTVAQMEAAFSTTLHDYASGSVRFRGREGPLHLPQSLAPFVEAVLGLDDRPMARPHIAHPQAAPLTSYTPPQLAQLYNFPPGDGSGQTIALVELGGNYGPADLQTYFAGLKIPLPALKTVSVSAGAPVPYGQDPNSDGEVMLDVEMVGAIAPGAAIVVYFSENTDQGFYQAASQAIHDAATTAVSISWGSAEKDWTQQSLDSWKTLGESAIMLNVAVFVAAGDHGCTDEQPGDPGYDGKLHVDFPGSCGTGIVSCGGTSLKSSGSAIASEAVWNDENGWATGGGVSAVFATPTWQRGLTTKAGTALAMRGVPDVAGDADPNTGILVRSNGSDETSGGTSAVAPLWAALTARLAGVLGRKPGFFIPLLYAAKSAGTHDITNGNNTVNGVTGFSAQPGWDACTGLGTPNGAALATLLATPSST
jgi:kumamolisin